MHDSGTPASECDDLRIERASPDDVPLLLELIRELAAAQRFPGELTVTDRDLRASLFGNNAAAEAVIGYVDGNAVSYAVFYHTFATTTGKRGLHLDDLLVRPHAQGRGIGRKMLGYLARVARERGCARFEWWTLDWNDRAIAFYESVGARNVEHLRVFRLSGEALDRVSRLW